MATEPTQLTVDKEETLFRGYIPINQQLLNKLEGSNKITDIIFNGNGYVTDALLYLIKRKVTQPGQKFSDVSTVDLTGCNLLSDHGVRCLLEILADSVQQGLKKIEFGGCTRLTDNTLAYMLEILPKFSTKITSSLMGTSVSYLGMYSTDVSTAGCPNDIYQGKKVDSHDCQVLIVPHSSLTSGFATYLKTGNIVDRKSAVLEQGLKAGDWNINLTEVSSTSCLYESVTNSNLTQVIIPFDSTAEPKSVKDHVMATIAKVVAKEPRHHSFPKRIESLNVGKMGERPFMDIHLLDRLEMFPNEDGRTVLRNVSTSEKSIGVYISNARLSRTNSYFEVEIKKCSGEGKFAVLIGCLYDQLFSDPKPMDSTSDTGGYVDGMEVSKVGQKFGFGVEGDWLSEYMPAPSAMFYFIQDGVKTYGKDKDNNLKDSPSSGMYPLVSVLGESIGEVIIPKLVQPPQDIHIKMTSGNRWIERKFTSYKDSLMVDKEGRIQLVKNTSYGNEGVFIGRYEMTMFNPLFAVCLEKLRVASGQHSSEFYLGVGYELYDKSSNKVHSCVFLHVKLKPYRKVWTCPECSNQNQGTAETCIICSVAKIPEEAKDAKHWKCSLCSTMNGLQNLMCGKCGLEMRPDGFGEFTHEVWTEINTQRESKVVETTETISEGDRFLVEVPPQSGDLTLVVFYHNDKKICEKKFPFKPAKASRLVPIIGLWNEQDVLLLDNYKQTYRAPAPYKDKITLGRSHFMKVMDNGEMEDSGDSPKSPKLYSIFVSKVPFNRNLLEFEVHIEKCDASRLVGIGGAGPDFDASKFVGWIAGSIGYHIDNGQIYDNSGSGTGKYAIADERDRRLNEGDTVLMKVLPLNDQTPLRFDEDDDLASQQNIKIQFYSNKELMHELEYEILTESFYPVINLKNAKVKVSNFYAETEEMWNALEAKKLQKNLDKTIKKKDSTTGVKEVYKGTEFLMVGVGKEGSDPSGKVQIVQQQISLKDWDELNRVTDCINKMEKNLGDLDFQEQFTFGQLCAVEDNMKLLQQNESRLSYHCMTLDGNQKQKQALLDKIASIQDRHKDYQQMKYRKSEEAIKDMEGILKTLDKHKMITLTKLTGILTASVNPDIQGLAVLPLLKAMQSEMLTLTKLIGILTASVNPDIQGLTILPLLKAMQSEGKVLLFDLGEDHVVCDLQFMFNVEDGLLQLLPTEMVNPKSMVTCIGQNSHIWTGEAMRTKVLGDSFTEEQIRFLKHVMVKLFGVIPLRCLHTSDQDEQMELVISQNLSSLQASMISFLKHVMVRLFGVIPLRCLRSSDQDEQIVYVISQNLSSSPASMNDYLPLSDRKDFIVMKQTYTLPVVLPSYMLSLVISNTIKYGRPVLITDKGVVYQNGCVQTIILKDVNETGQEVLVIESRCYMPELQEDRNMSKQTASYVQDFTWNVFCIFTDILDDLFRRSNVVVMTTKDIPLGMVNVSVGCKHTWVAVENKPVSQNICTMCNLCCEKGDHCKWNGLITDYLRNCECGTGLAGCNYCGICVTCAADLWGIRSRLRPYSLVKTCVEETVKEKTQVKSKEESDSQVITWNAEKQPDISLDPFMYNEVEFTNLSVHDKIVCLRNKEDGTILQAYPGKAHYIENLKSVDLKSVGLKKYNLSVGDNIVLKLSDESGSSYRPQEKKEGEGEIKLEPQYFASTGREVKVIHETGVLVYETASSAIPVGQFISCKPLTKDNPDFSVRILSSGKGGYIAIGLVPLNYPPNRQPGWNSQAIGYHADDGGIFLESGHPTRKTLKATVGDEMSFHCDFTRNKGFFRRNGEKCIELNLNPSRLGYYPCVGFHSLGESVQLLQKEIWTPRNDSERNIETPAFSTYKYGNLWISPGKVVNFTKVGGEYCGWVILHNPLKEQVGFKVTGSSNQKHTCFGVIEDKKNWVHHFAVKRDEILEAVTVEWMSLETGRTYSKEDMEQIFGAVEYTHQGGFQHRIKVKIVEAQNVVEELPTVAATTDSEVIKRCMRLKVYKNKLLLDEYYLEQGYYHVAVETDNKDANFILRYPKCPSYQYPKIYQKGMKMIAYLESQGHYAECVLVDVYSGGKMLALEYSPEDRNTNTTICVKADSPVLNFREDQFKGEESTIIRYESRNTPASLTKTFVNAPPYLLSKAAQNVFEFIDKDWKSNVLKKFKLCGQVFTRLTVQEHSVCKASRSALDWLKDDEDMYLYTFLPSDMSFDLLMYPNLTSVFKDIAIHRPCFSYNEMGLIQVLSSLPHSRIWKIPIHFVDMPGTVPQTSLSIEALYGDLKNVWTYMALIGQKLNLSSYKNLIKGDSSGLSESQVEQLMCNLLKSYTSLCGIYNAAWGGVEYTPTNEDRQEVKSAIPNKADYVKKFSGKPQTEEDMLFKFTSFDKYAVCKAHCLNNDVTDVMLAEKDIKFSYDYFEPYLKSVSVFDWSLTTLKELPADFFEKFVNLQYFKLGSRSVGKHMGRLTSIPAGFQKAKSLQVVIVHNTAITELPMDIFMCPTVAEMTLQNMPIKKLPEDFADNSDLRSLNLEGLLLDTVPKHLGRLKSLEYLSLNQNPITSLPESLIELKNLKSLDLTGARWFTRETCKNMHHLVRDAYMEWHAQYPVLRNYFGEEVIEKLFDEFDINLNGSLDEEELALLNLKLFFDFPRIGIKDINDDVTGGIPSVVFHLQSLNKLILDYNAITMVPQAINNLQNLEYLSLNQNPLLESLPGSLGHLPNINKINIKSCPMLRTPPNEVVSRGFDSVKAYLKKLAGGFTECRRTKLMVVGLGGAGKTSLLRALMSDSKKTSGTEKEIPTDGIDIIPWTIQSKDNREVTYSTWDFAGQAVYYNTHQFFLSKRAVYLLLWSMRQGYEHAGLDFWLSSISCHAPGTPIIVIGTQCDLIPQAEIPEKELRERYPQIASFHQVSSVNGTGIADLQDDLLEITLQQGYMGEKIPQVWLNFEKRILAERLTKVSYIKWDVAKRYAMEQGIYDEKDVRMAVQLLHDLGTVQYFDNDFLRDYVVINPQWIVNVMACVVSAQDSPIQKNQGRFLHSDIPVIWKEYEPELHKWLLRLTEDFDLTFPLPKEPVNIVPCLLPAEEPEELKWPSVRDNKGERETKMVYKFTYLPSGLFNRAQVRLFQFSDGKQVWKKGSLLSKNKHLALIKQSDNTELVVFVQGPRPENILFLIHEVFESIIEESFNGVSYDLLVPCPDCITKEGTFDPCLLNAELIQRAKDLKAPFLQCYKYFHWISMAHLEEKLPTTSRDVADFDIQLQQSIVALEELNSDLIRDVAIIYSSANVPGSNDKDNIPPSLIRDDVIKWGYSCWFADDMNTVSSVDLTTAFKHCKVLIALVSDEFERDTTCRDMFLYAKETMNKEIITVVLGDSTEWMNKDLGMKIGNQERKLMAKTLQRYVVEGGRRDELKKWLEEKIMLSRMDEDSPPEVFLSYCWSNSQDAQEKSGKHLPAALGWADPRNLRSQLQESGLNCWIDIEYVGREKKGIFRDMANGIRNSRVMLACISDEYADSDNCMMELRFGILNLELPIVVAVVGQGSEWKETEVAMLLRRAKAPEVHLQKDNPEGCNILVKYLKDMIVSAELSKDKKPKRKDAKAKLLQDVKGEKKEEKSSSIAYQEEYELIQRKFMRHIITAISARDSNPLPRLIVVDFIKSASTTQGEDGRESSVRKTVSKSRKILRPKSATRSRDRLQVDESVFDDDVEDWSRESFCIKVLCENEEGWHLCEEKYPLAFRNHEQLESYLNKAAPYLYRIYSILRQSPIKLNCFTGGKNGKGEAYQAWIRSESESNLDFIGAMMHLRSELSSDEAAQFVSCLERCRLPSGKIVWLCEKHQNLTHVAKLSTGSTGGSHNVQKVLFSEDKLLMENMEKSEQYKKLRSIKSSQVESNLPAPVPIPQFTPKVVQTPSKPTDKTPSKPPTPKPPTPKPQPKEENSKTQGKEERPKSQAKDEPPKPQVERKPSVQNLQQDTNKSKEKDVENGSKQINTLPEEKDLESDIVNKPVPPNKQLLKTYSRSDVQQQIRNMVLNSDNNASLLKKKGRSLTKARSTANVYSTMNQPNKTEDTKPKNGFDRLQQQAIKSQKQSVTQPKIGQPNVPLDPKPPQSRIVKGSTIKRDMIKEDTGKSVPSKEDIQVNLRIKSSDSENSQSNKSTTKSEATSMTKSEVSRMSVSKRQQPRQIKVKEYNNVTNNAKGAGLTATGTTIGTSIGQPIGGEMPLPESNTSKACVIQ